MSKPQIPVQAKPGDVSRKEDVAAFLDRLKAIPPEAKGHGHGRLVFAMDATMSRQPAWDSALQIQADMFRKAAEVGSLNIQLAYFRGFNECRSSRWVNNPEALARLMSKIRCEGGHTQIARILKHVLNEASDSKLHAVVFVGDAMEESVDQLCHLAGQIGILGVPVFMFQEGFDVSVERAYREIARLTRGAYFRFDAGSARILRDLLTAVAVYAAGGRTALADHSKANGGSAVLLLEQLR